MRKRIFTAGLALAAVAGLGLTAALTAGSASAAPENPALTGKRVLCITSTGDFKALDAPCSDHKDAAGKAMWFAGPLPVPGAAGYAESVQAIAGGGSGGLTEAEVKSLVDAQVAAALQTITSGLPSKSVTVKFDADWATNAAIKKINAPFVKQPPVNSAGYLNVDLAKLGTSTEAAVPVQFPANANPNNGTPRTRFYFAVTQSGVAPYAANQRELWWSNVSATTMASESDIQVDGLVQPSIGATTRTWIVSMARGANDGAAEVANGTIDAYGNSRAFTFVGSVLVP